jgi:hypothetical protein
MSLYVDQSLGVDDPSFDLFTISWQDGNLNAGAPVTTTLAGTLPVAGSTIPVTQVTYPPPGVTTSMPTAQRLFELITKDAGDKLNWSWPIVITALYGGTEPYLGMSIEGISIVYVDHAATPPIIHVSYDTSQHGGVGIFCFEVPSGSNAPKQIAMPNPVLLYHALSHAYHIAIDKFPFPQSFCKGRHAPAASDADEPAAATDENVLRGQLGLPLRDVCNEKLVYGVGSH